MTSPSHLPSVLLRWVGLTSLVLVFVDLMVLDPVQTVTTDLPRLYAQMGFSGLLELGFFAIGWLAAAAVGVHFSAVAIGCSTRPLLERSSAALAVFGGVLLSTFFPQLSAGLSFYFAAEDGGFAPLGGSAGVGFYVSMSAAFLSLGTALLLWLASRLPARLQPGALVWAGVLAAALVCFLVASTLRAASLPEALLAFVLYFASVALPLGLAALPLLGRLVGRPSPSDL